MEVTPTREILWNIGTTPNIVAMYALLAVSLGIGAIGVFRHAELWYSGKRASDQDLPAYVRAWNFLTYVVLQRRVIKSPSAGFAHTLVYIGFLVLLLTTTVVAIHHDLGFHIYVGDLYLALTVASDLFGLGLIAGCLVFAHRRYVKRPDLLHSRSGDALLLGVLILLCVQGFLLEALRIHVKGDAWSIYSPVGLLLSKFFWNLSPETGAVLHYFVWWFHTLTVFACIALAPYSKFFHIIASSLNLALRNFSKPKGALEYPGDLEKLMESGEEFSLGLGTIKDYSWKQLLDLDACTSCGRCQDACPAYNSGKPLSPKWVILDTRNHALKLQHNGKLAPSHMPEAAQDLDRALNEALFFPAHGIPLTESTYTNGGAFRSANPLVQSSALSIGIDPEHRIAGEVMDPNVFWSCTTCMACVQACPVGINHVDQIMGNRRNMALMHGEIPSEAQGTLRALENRANPYGDPKDRTKWTQGLDIPVLSPGDSVDYLYWVGCVSAFDPRKQKIAKALTYVMKKAGLSFGILGTAEGCSGDPARRLGEENLFQTLAKSNIETLKSVQFKTLVANCPHCFNTIKNEYPQFGNLGEGKTPEIIHHSQLLKRLLKQGKITLNDALADSQEITFHDPCYLGRYNDEYDAPRETLRAVKGLKILEMEKSRENGMCCGAGGGHFWMDLKVGERVNVLRTNQAAATGASRIATGCPFCMQMMEDGTKLTGREETLDVRDIAEVIAERLA
jgi:Fe-S oxidoreductase/nitrate reductase gamma subunit